MGKKDLMQYSTNISNNDKKYYIYKHTSPSGKVYIGKTCYKYPKQRWKKDGSGYIGCPYFYNAIIKYGWDNIKHEILYENLNNDEAIQREIELISKYKALGISYNCTDGGEGASIKHSKEWNEKISKSHKGKKISEESKEKMRIAHTGKSLSDSHKDKISKSLKGVKKSDLHCKNIKENHWDISGENHPNWGKHLNDNTKKKISAANSNKLGINKDGIEIRISNNELETYLKNGWKIGGLPKPPRSEPNNNLGKTKLKKENEILYVINNEVGKYVMSGWEICNERRRRQYRLYGVIKY